MHSPLPDLQALHDDARPRIAQTEPWATHLDVYCFPQTWGSTALGFGGIGGQAITQAQTTVFVCPYTYVAAVYFGSRFAYLVPRPSDGFWQALREWNMPPVSRTGHLNHPE